MSEHKPEQITIAPEVAEQILEQARHVTEQAEENLSNGQNISASEEKRGIDNKILISIANNINNMAVQINEGEQQKRRSRNGYVIFFGVLLVFLILCQIRVSCICNCSNYCGHFCYCTNTC